jgi:hypothetical protein
MSAIYSVAMTEGTDARLREHLVREDGQEDLCFALYRPSRGERRLTGLIGDVLLPQDEDRQVHYNASFNPCYFERAISEAIRKECGLALLHTHPLATGWQDLSEADHLAESGMAAAVQSATGLPLGGLTLSGKSGFWSARFWHQADSRVWDRVDCENVRVVGLDLAISVCPRVKPDFDIPEALKRTVHAWGPGAQQALAHLRVGIVGLGSVGSLLSEQLARSGFTEVIGIDPDVMKEHNRDRTLHASKETIEKAMPKVEVARSHALCSATMPCFRFRALECGIQEEKAYRAALDCDVILSGVDRPWPRSIMNHLSYAALMPVIDGGIKVSLKGDGTLRSADWGAFVVGPGRRCLECAEQFDAGLVAVEHDGDLDDPAYIEGLPEDSPLKKSENVFVFSTALAASIVLKLVQLIGKPSGLHAPMEERYTFPASHAEVINEAKCGTNCWFRGIVGQGDAAGSPLA